MFDGCCIGVARWDENVRDSFHKTSKASSQSGTSNEIATSQFEKIYGYIGFTSTEYHNFVFTVWFSKMIQCPLVQ